MNKNGIVRTLSLTVATALLIGTIGFIAKTQYGIAIDLRQIKVESQAQWSLLRELSSEFRNHKVDVEYIKQIQSNFILPNLGWDRNSETVADQSQEQGHDQNQDQDLGWHKRLEKLQKSKIYGDEVMKGGLENYVQQQLQLQETLK